MFLLVLNYHYKVLLRVQVWDLYMTVTLFQHQIRMSRNRNPNFPNYSIHRVLYIETNKVFDYMTPFRYSSVVICWILLQCLPRYRVCGNQNHSLIYLTNTHFKQMFIENTVTTSLTPLTSCDVHININKSNNFIICVLEGNDFASVSTNFLFDCWTGLTEWLFLFFRSFTSIFIMSKIPCKSGVSCVFCQIIEHFEKHIEKLLFFNSWILYNTHHKCKELELVTGILFVHVTLSITFSCFHAYVIVCFSILLVWCLILCF